MNSAWNRTRRLLHSLAFFATATLTATSLTGPSLAQDYINDELRVTPRYVPPDPVTYGYGEREYDVATGEFYLTASAIGRASVIGDDTRLAKFAGGNFLPSAIPAAGEPFFGAGPRATVLGSGSAVRLSAQTSSARALRLSAHSQFLVNDLGFATTGEALDGNISIRQAFGRINRLSVGLMESAFANPAALPETLDLAGPNARITVNDAGLGKGVGRISYDFFDDPDDGGFTVTTSLEQPVPEITGDMTTDDFARHPDFVCVSQYVAGYMQGKTLMERWRLQLGLLVRSLGLENNASTLEEHAVGWGASLSGAYLFPPKRCLTRRDRVAFSVTYGEGIAHYTTDLNALDSRDAVLNPAGTLTPLPVLAWYAGYTHNWTDFLRSTATYSRVDLDSITPLGGAATSPYRSGEYVAANLVYHTVIPALLPGDPKRKDARFFTGLEYLFGSKEVLGGSAGEAHRVMWTTAIVQ